jgi:putative oxidoreductase
MFDLAVLILRVAVGALLAAHGAQKLFGAFGGPGLGGTQKIIESLGIRPAWFWALLGGLSEFGGGILTALGFLSPLGPLGILAAMAIAVFRAHWGKPIWATEGGAEFALTNAAIVIALALAGPGRYSLDAAFGVVLPAWIIWSAVALVVLGVASALASGATAQRAARAERDRKAA